MSTSERDLGAAVAVLHDHLRQPDAHRVAAELDEAAVQALLAAAVRAYATKVEQDGAFPPFDDAATPNATEALTAVAAILRAVEVEAFELGMWMNLSAGQSARRGRGEREHE